MSTRTGELRPAWDTDARRLDRLLRHRRSGDSQLRGFTAICALIALACGIAAGPTDVRAASCSKEEFESAVENAAKALRELNSRNKQPFQDKLRALKQKRAWSDEQFMKEAAIYVQDDTIAALDARSGELLGHINRMGAAGASGGEPDCKLLQDLRASMTALVNAQVEKWRHMFAKLDAALKP